MRLIPLSPELLEMGRYTDEMRAIGHDMVRRLFERPFCYNRQPFTGYWARRGYRKGKPVLRWVEYRMSQSCKAYSVPPGTVPVPVREGWRCDGCRLDPRA